MTQEIQLTEKQRQVIDYIRQRLEDRIGGIRIIGSHDRENGLHLSRDPMDRCESGTGKPAKNNV